MAAKSSTANRRSQEADNQPMNAQAQQQFADLTENSAYLFRELETVQQIHQHSAQRAALKLQQAAEQLRSATSSTEWLSVQSTLMWGGVQDMMQYMQELSMTLLRMQVAVMPKQHAGRSAEANAAAGQDSPTGSPLSTVSTAQDAANAATAATAAVIQSWSNMLGAGLHPPEGRAHH